VSAISQFFAAHGADPAVELLARTTAAVRADAAFDQRGADAIGGAVLSDEPPAALNAHALDMVMARIDRADALEAHAATQAEKGGWRAEIAALPSPLREAAFDALEKRGWMFGGLGIRRLPLTHGDGAFAELMRIEPGRGVPDHDHADDEATLILTGGYHDGHHHYGPGDISLARSSFVHTPKADPGEVCYVLAISYGPPRLKGPYRLLQRWLAEPAEAKAVWRSR